MSKQISVLLADDNRYIRESLQAIISCQQDMQLVGQACNGEEAILFADEMRPDIILMDINMSPINGFEATREILKKNPAIKIIGLSLHAEPEYRKNMLRMGASGYIVKSSTYEEIVKGIKEVAGMIKGDVQNPALYTKAIC